MKMYSDRRNNMSLTTVTLGTTCIIVPVTFAMTAKKQTFQILKCLPDALCFKQTLIHTFSVGISKNKEPYTVFYINKRPVRLSFDLGKRLHEDPCSCFSFKQ